MIKQTLQVHLASILKTSVPASVFRKHGSNKCPDTHRGKHRREGCRKMEDWNDEVTSQEIAQSHQKQEDKNGSCPGTLGGSMVLLIPQFRTPGFQIHKRIFLKSMVLRTITSWLLVGAVPHCVIHSMKTQDEWRLDWKTIARWKEMLQHVDTIVSDPHSLKNSLSLWASLSPMNSETQVSKYFHGMGNFTYLTPYSIPALFKWKDYSSAHTVRSKGIFLRIKT